MLFFRILTGSILFPCSFYYSINHHSCISFYLYFYNHKITALSSCSAGSGGPSINHQVHYPSTLHLRVCLGGLCLLFVHCWVPASVLLGCDPMLGARTRCVGRIYLTPCMPCRCSTSARILVFLILYLMPEPSPALLSLLAEPPGPAGFRF